MPQKCGVITLKKQYFMCTAVKAYIIGTIMMLFWEFHHGLMPRKYTGISLLHKSYNLCLWDPPRLKFNRANALLALDVQHKSRGVKLNTQRNITVIKNAWSYTSTLPYALMVCTWITYFNVYNLLCFPQCSAYCVVYVTAPRSCVCKCG